MCYDAGLLLGCFAFLYANLFANPQTPFLLNGDQVFFWMNAQRLLHGEQIYRDFFEFTPPGTDLLYFAIFKLFGPRIWMPNWVVLALGMALCTLCLHISKSIMPRAQAALATSLYLVFVIGMTLDGTHHWFSLLAVMGAVAILVNGSTHTRVASAGALLGLTAFITQTRGPVAAVGVAAWMTWARYRTQELWSTYWKRQVFLFATLNAYSDLGCTQRVLHCHGRPATAMVFSGDLCAAVQSRRMECRKHRISTGSVTRVAAGAGSMAVRLCGVAGGVRGQSVAMLQDFEGSWMGPFRPRLSSDHRRNAAFRGDCTEPELFPVLLCLPSRRHPDGLACGGAW